MNKDAENSQGSSERQPPRHGYGAPRTLQEATQISRDLSMLLEVMPDVLILAAPNRRITTVNNAFTCHFGYEEEEAVGQTTKFLYAHPQDFQQTGKRYNPEAPDRREPYRIEYRRKDGSTFLGETIGVHVRDDHGQTMGYVGIIKDVTEEVRREEERRNFLEQLQHSEELLRETSRLAKVGGGEFYVGDEEVNWSDELYRIYDLPIGTSLTTEDTLEFFEEDAQKYLESAVKETLATGKPFEMELPMSTAIGREKWIRTKGVPIVEDDQILGITGYTQDITETKQAEQAKREFISVVSHELRTPVTSIRGTLGLVLHGVTGELPEEAQEMLQIALRNTERLGALIDDILDMERIDSGKISIHLRSTDPRSIVDEVLESQRQLAIDFDVKLEVLDSPSRPWLCADPDKLHQVLMNLVSNAIKYSPSGECVDISIVTTTEDMVRISVRDRGSGIPEEFQASLFEKFTRADTSDTRRREGTGLGLSIAKRLTEEMGGRIGFETAAGEGTTMFVEFPSAHESGEGIKTEGA